MNCEQCKEKISAFLDNELDEQIAAEMQTHLTLCADCAKVCEDFAIIIDFCVDDQFEEVDEPNSQALWCRINNIIETEVQPELESERKEKEARRGWFAGVFRHNLQLSFSQTLTAILGIALISSLLTVVGVKNFSRQNDELSSQTSVSETIFDKILGKFGLIETPQQARIRRIKEQQKAIDYWNQRVEVRRQNWNGKLRETFDRNLREIDQVVYDYNKILEKNPEDALTSEMLDSAMKEKMELLREFSEL
ncbi:MAG: zf-HC2 domain-containing protein [Pyrinomonadaceae bacterium]